MFTLQLLLALIITCLPVWVWLERLVPVGATCRRLLIGGYTLFLGMMLVTLIMRFLSVIGVSFSVGSIGGVGAFVFFAGVLAPRSWRMTALPSQPAPVLNRQIAGIHRLVFGICLALLASRVLVLGLEIGTRPLFAWDALQHWTKQAKVFFDQGSTVPYVALNEWLAMGGKGVYTNMHPDYAITTPLLQTWTNVALGSWHDSLMSFPWLLIFVSLGLVFYAQARVAKIDSTTAIAATYMALSLPYLNVQVALPGYADLLVALSFLAAFAAFYNWSCDRQSWQALLCILCALCGLLVKNEGFYWFLTFGSGWLLASLGVKRGLLVGGTLLLGLLLVLRLMPDTWVIAGHSLQELSLGYRPEAWTAVYISFLKHDNWHFLSYLFLAALTMFIWHARQLAPMLAPVVAIVLSALALYLGLYLFTRYSFGAVRMTSLNRVALQLMPVVAFFTLLVYASVSRNRVLAPAQQR